MSTLALYVPKPVEFWQSVGLLLIVYVIACALAFRLKLRLPISALLIALGGFMALLPGIFTAIGSDLGEYGNLAREQSATDLSDAFFAMTMHLYVEYGCLLAAGGMFSGVLVSILLKQWRTRPPARGFDREPLQTEVQTDDVQGHATS